MILGLVDHAAKGWIGKITRKRPLMARGPSMSAICRARLVSLRSPAESSLKGAWTKEKLADRFWPSRSSMLFPGLVK
jgi:hypothetical protein